MAPQVPPCDRIEAILLRCYPMRAHRKPTYKSLLPAALLMALFGWGGLIIVISQTLPTLGPRWLFFFFSVLAITGTVLPIAAYLNLRFPAAPAVNESTVLREALFMGIFITTLTWLQLNRASSAPIALILAIGFVVIDWLIRMREQSRWEP